MSGQEDDELILSLIYDRAIAYRPILAHACGGATAALFLSQLLYHVRDDRDGYVPWRGADISRETGLSERERETAVRNLLELGIVETIRRSVPPVAEYRVVREALVSALRTYSQIARNVLFEKDETSSLKRTKRPERIARNVPNVEDETSCLELTPYNVRALRSPDPEDSRKIPEALRAVQPPQTAPPSPTPAPPADAPQKRPTRIPEGFQVTPPMLGWATGEGFSPEDVHYHTKRFLAYWQGSGGTKVDWAATWRSWLLKETPGARNGRGKPPPKTLAETASEIHRQLYGEEMPTPNTPGALNPCSPKR